MPFKYLNDENKQHINLSLTATAIIENDMFSFNVTSKSGFINQIISNYRENSEASISISEKRKKKEYERILCSEHSINPDNKVELINLLVKEYVNKLIKKSMNYNKGKSFKFRINKENQEYLTQECNENEYYCDNIGKYLKALIEDYCTKSYLKREMIFFKTYFTTIEQAINEKKLLKIQLSNGRYKYIQPFKVMTDPLSMYHYLIGYSNDKSNIHKKSQSFSYRITNLRKVKMLQESIHISENCSKNLLNEIQSRGVQFMSEDTCIIKIYLTDAGITKYNRLLHLRPQYTSIDNDKHIYTFDCTARQIEYYFFKFGEDAKVIYPDEIRKKFKSMYLNAVRQYND